MSTPENLMGLGLPHFLAARVGLRVQAVTVAGATAGAARQLPGVPGIYFVNASNSGSGLALPLVGGDAPDRGINLSDHVQVANIIGATIYVYANANAAGSAVTLYGAGLSAVGTTGISVQTGMIADLQPITVSTWIFTRAPASA